jgi:hypothetical protein
MVSLSFQTFSKKVKPDNTTFLLIGWIKTAGVACWIER